MELPSQGETFHGKYKLHEILGKGGFAAVYRATDVEIGRDVAIKVLAPSEDGYSKGLESRFMREARVIAQLRDPHTITMFEFGHSDSGLLFMVFEYLRGTDLSLLTKRSAVPEEATCHVLEQVLQSLREAHAAGVLHRDIKPANIMIYEYMDDPWRAKLLDFGIAKAVNGSEGVDLTSAGAMIGTPRYMSPEQIYGGDLTATSDIYSLGLVAYEMLCGGPAIKGKTTKEMMVQQLGDTPVTLPPEVPVSPGLRNIVNRMTARDPESRFPSAEALLHALDNLKSMRATGRMPTLGPQNFGPNPGSGPNPQPPGGYYSPTPQPTGPHTPVGHGQPGPAPPTAQQPQPNPFPHGRPATRGMTTLPPQPLPPRGGIPTWAMAAGGAAVGALVVVGVLTMGDKSEPEVVVARPSQAANPLAIIEQDAGPKAEPAAVAAKAPDAGLAAADMGGGDAGVAVAAGGCGKTTDWVGSQQVSVEGPRRRRRLIVYVPEGYDSSREYPVVMLYHKAFNSAAWLLKDTDIRPLADKEQFVVLSMDAAESTSPWEGAEVEFAEGALATASNELCIDRTRVFAVGHGGGGEFIRRLSCHFPLAGIASAGSGEARGERVCVTDPAVPYIRTAGLQDKYLPVGGGSGCLGGNYKSIREIEEDWKTLNHCTGPSKTWMKKGKDVCYEWECESPFVSCHLQGGHDWPNSTPEKFEMPGCPHPPPKFPMIEAMWNFFKEQKPVIPEEFYAKLGKKK